MAYSYTTQSTDNMAKAVGIALPISRKQSVNICNTIRGMTVQKAKKLLEEVIEKKKAISFTVYNMNTGHKAGMGPGSFPITACQNILGVLKNAEANAQFKGLSTGNLIIKGASAQKGPTTHHYGRQRSKAKRTHIELVVEEVKKQEAPAKKARQPKTTEAKK